MKSYSKSKILVVLILILIISMSNLFLQQPSTSKGYNNPLLEENPKLKSPDITIITPENKTYTEPMSGYYLATFGFENDMAGNYPSMWEIDDTYGTVRVIEELEGHKKVLELEDTSDLGLIFANQTFSLQGFGTVELWWRLNDTSKRATVALKNSITVNAVITLLWQGDINSWRYAIGSSWYDVPNIPNPVANTWYRMIIDFERTTGNYQGLGQNKWNVNFNGVNSGELNLRNNEDVDAITILTPYALDQDFSFYIDAVGYSWDQNYNLGDNLNEGLLLSFENSTSLDWIGYSLDGQLNNTILGNSTFPMPKAGLHTIQVFGNDTVGAMHQSSLRYFTIKAISIITPENKTYTGPMSGYYPATYGFENDEIGSYPEEWIIYNTGGGTMSVIESIDGHNNVLELHDTSNTALLSTGTAFSQQSYGTIEYYMRSSDSSQQTTLRIIRPGGQLFRFGIIANDFYYNDGSWNNVGLSASSNVWYHIAIHFECTSGGYMGLSQYNWRVEIDGVTYGDYGYITNYDYTDDISFHVPDLDYNVYYYIDALGFSWDVNYNVGDNLNEGLLLSFENRTSLDWIGYSLDGNANRTILGNTTIKLPVNGIHNIQVFGNKTLGDLYESDIRYFSVKFIQINLITPQNIIYTEPMSGYYPATYGFENDANGTHPEAFDTNEPISSQIQVIDELDGHMKVVEIDDRNGTAGWPYIRQYSYFPRSYGTIEFWVRFNTTFGMYQFISRDTSNGQVLLSLRVEDGKWKYLIGITRYDVPNIPDPQVNTWHHIRIDFRCQGAPSYLGISQDRYIATIDGISSGEIQHANSGLLDYNFFMVGTTNTAVMKGWVDAIGFSWDPNYNLGDNLNEGLLVSFENSSSLDWIGYSLDGQANKTILGNTTIPIPPNGLHTIQIIGSIYGGFIYESDIIHFTINISEDQTPSNGSEDINYILIIALIAILSSMGIVVVAIIYTRVHVPSEKPKPKKREIKKLKEEGISGELINCPFCLTEIRVDQKFCTYCGSKIKEDESI
ncbi:MAG: zinc ribbon domain-containing protein [Candidatus Hodarchaeota archaeon]